jgi:hypothetical protein
MKDLNEICVKVDFSFLESKDPTDQSSTQEPAEAKESKEAKVAKMRVAVLTDKSILPLPGGIFLGTAETHIMG